MQLHCHYVKVLGVDRDYSFYGAFMSALLIATGQSKLVLLSIFSFGRIDGGISGDTMMYVLC